MHGGFLKIVLTSWQISLILDWYVFSGLKTLTADWRSIRWPQMVKWGWLVFSVGITLIFIGVSAASEPQKG